MMSNEQSADKRWQPAGDHHLEFAERIRKHFENPPPIVFEPLPEDDPKRRCPDITKAKRILKWEPKVELEEGLKLTLAHFKEVFNKK